MRHEEIEEVRKRAVDLGLEVQTLRTGGEVMFSFLVPDQDLTRIRTGGMTGPAVDAFLDGYEMGRAPLAKLRRNVIECIDALGLRPSI
jgi:hypothetical protein